MKKLYSLILAWSSCMSITAVAQCTSSASTYDLTVSSNMTLPPNGTPYTMGVICPGAVLIDSEMCCTRFIHISAGAVYRTGPMAYGIIYIKAGGTFDAQGNTLISNVYYEPGGTLLNYAGPSTMCNSVVFPPPNCSISIGIDETSANTTHTVFPNPATDILNVTNVSANAAITIYELTGKKILEKQMNVTNNNQVNISSLSEGMYIYSIKEKEGSISFGRFMVVK